ncbi:POK9 protein, partial [Scytalopus superciliaris]|nr:POK9 protein [Scytalopus superciliaris]
GSPGLDMAVAASTTITDSQVTIVPSTVTGPLGHGLSALLLGRSSASKQGILVIPGGILVRPGVIDADYTGNIGIMVRVLNPPLTIAEGTKIAQLVPFKACVSQATTRVRGDGAFESTGQPLVAFTQKITEEKPRRRVIIQGPNQSAISALMLLDTGSDVTII